MLTRACHEARYVTARQRATSRRASRATPTKPGGAAPRRSRHLAFSYGDVFERPGDTIAEILSAMRTAR